MQSPVQWFSAASRNSRTLRLLGIGMLVLVLRIPIGLIDGLVSERQQRSNAAAAEVTSRWGGAQAIAGPALIIPVTRFRAGAAADDAARIEKRNAVFLSRKLQLRGALRTEIRRRGIFDVPVYSLDLTVQGEFGPVELASLGVRASDVEWDRAALAVGIGDVHALRGQPVLDWNGAGIAFKPGAAGLDAATDGIHAPVDIGDGSGGWTFSFPLSLNGSRELMFTPFAEDTLVELESNDAHPVFQGRWLPSRRDVSGAGFTAQWSISFLGRGYAQAWLAAPATASAVEASRFGVRLQEPVDHYRMSERSVKYAILFVLLTFVLLWAMEVFTDIRIHPVQYLLFGSALCMFYLLLLSLSEHVGFAPAYAAASALIVLTVTGYSAAVLQRRPRSLLVGAACSGLYAWLYFALANEDYSLLFGTTLLFLVLSAIMYFTRHRNWYDRA
jgi:inner membrane protein